jgi:hypothetical protein
VGAIKTSVVDRVVVEGFEGGVDDLDEREGLVAGPGDELQLERYQDVVLELPDLRSVVCRLEDP